MMPERYLVTCEHGGNRVPSACRALLAPLAEDLASHRGHDLGALAVARTLAATLDAPLIASTISRLVVDLNRSPHHPRLHAAPIRAAPAALRELIVARYYLPHRRRVEATVAAAEAAGARLVHIASHSFTPELDGQVRNADIGLLYDPARAAEAELCRRWQAALAHHAPTLKVRRNYPYRGASDGLSTWLRRRFPPDRYLGIELELNQRHVQHDGPHWRALQQQLAASLREALRTDGA